MRKHKHAAEIHLLVGFSVPLEHRKTLKRQFGLNLSKLETGTREGVSARIRGQVCRLAVFV